MSNKEVETPQDALISAVEYLLNVRQEQLGEALWEPAQRGDRELIQRLRTETDEISQILQNLRNQKEQSQVIKTEPVCDHVTIRV